MSHQFAGSQEVPGLYETSASSASGSMSTHASSGIRMSSHQQRHYAAQSQSYYAQPSPPRQYQTYRQQRHVPSPTDSVPSTGTPQKTTSPRGHNPQMMASSAPRGGSDPANDDPYSYPQDNQSWVSAPNPSSPSRIYAAAAAKLAERKNGYRREYSRTQRGATEQQHLQQQRQQLNSSPISEPNFHTSRAASDVDVSRFTRHVNRFAAHDPRTSSPSQQQRPRSKSSGNPSELGRTSGSVSERTRKLSTGPDYEYPDPDAVVLMSIDSESVRHSPDQPHFRQQPHHVPSSSSGSRARVTVGQRFEGTSREATRSPREQDHRMRASPPAPPATTPPSSSSFSTRIAKLQDVAEGVSGPNSVEEHRQPRSVEQHQRMRHRNANSLPPQRRVHTHPNNCTMGGEPGAARIPRSSTNKDYRVADARSRSKSPVYMQQRGGDHPRTIGGDPTTRVQKSNSSPHRLGAVPRSHSRSPTDGEQVPLQKINPYSASPPRDGDARHLSNGSVDDSGIVSVETPSITSVTDLRKRLWNEQERLQVAVPPSLPEHGDAHARHWMHYNGPEMAGRRGQRTPPELPPAAPVHHEHQRMSRSLSPDRPQYRRRSPDARQPQDAQSASGGGALFKSRFYQAAMAAQQGRGRPARQQQGQHEGKEMDDRRPYIDPRDQRSRPERAAANVPAPQSMRRSPPPPETHRNPREQSKGRAHSVSASEPGRQRPHPTTTAAHVPPPQSMWRSPPQSDPQGHPRNETIEHAQTLPTSEPRHQRPPPVAGGASSPATSSILRSASPPEPRLNMSSSASNESSVAKLVAKLNAVSRNNPEAALHTIDSILRAETGSSGGPGSTRNSPSHFARQTSDVTPQPDNRVPEHMSQHHNESEQHDNEESSSEDSDDETSVSSITNPTFHSGKAPSNQPASAPNASTSAFRRPRPSSLNAYGNSAGKREVRGKSSRKKGPAGPPPMATIKVSSTSKTPLSPIAAQRSATGHEDGDEYSEDPVPHRCPICSAVVCFAVDRSDDERFYKCGSCPWNSKHSSPVVNAQSASAVALKISRWQEMSQTDHRSPPRDQAFGLSPSSSRSETAQTEDLGSILTPGDTGLGSIVTPGDTADSDGLSSGRAHPWDNHHPGEQVTYDTSMTDGDGLEVVISDVFHGTPKTGFTGDRFDVDPQLMNSQGSVQSRGTPSIDTEQHQHEQTAMSDAFDDAWVSLPSSAFHPCKPRTTAPPPRTTAPPPRATVQQPTTAPQNDFADWESQVKSAKPQQRKSPLPSGVTGAFDGKEDLLPTTPTSLISDAFAGKTDLLPSTSNEDNSLSGSYVDMDGPPGHESGRDSGKKRKGLKGFLKRNSKASTQGSINTASLSSSTHRKGRPLMSSYALDSESEGRAAGTRRSKSKSPERSVKKFWR